MRSYSRTAIAMTALSVPLLGVTLIPPPATAGAAADAAVPPVFAKLHAVSASSSTDAWAVGVRKPVGGEDIALARHWDGSAWTTVPSPHPGAATFLWGVADVSPSDAWAVGETFGEFATDLPFAEHWNGTTWEIQPLRNPPGLGQLNAVSASGPDDVWMIGTQYPGGGLARNFIEHWNGSRMARVRPAFLNHARSSELTGITAVAPDDVWAVGSQTRHSRLGLPVVEHYDGTSWTAVAGDPAIGSGAVLSGVTAVSGGDAWAVGWHAFDGDPANSAVAEHWDGTQWTVSPVLTPGLLNYFTGVSMVAEDDVWAVGYWQPRQGPARSRPLIEHWDGAAWSIVGSPRGGPGASVSIESVSMNGATSGYAVGEKIIDSHTTAYLVRWDGDSWTRH